MNRRVYKQGMPAEALSAAHFPSLGGNFSMASYATRDFIDDKVPLEAYDELRRWLGKWASQEFDLEKRLAAFVTLENLNSFVQAMLSENSPNNLH